MSVRFEKLKPSAKISELTDAYKKKIESSLLPPDPARLVEYIMRVPPTIEHMLPLPPVLETIHEEVVSKLVESLPRLPLTSEPPITKWKEWIKEEM